MCMYSPLKTRNNDPFSPFSLYSPWLFIYTTIDSLFCMLSVPQIQSQCCQAGVCICPSRLVITVPFTPFSLYPPWVFICYSLISVLFCICGVFSLPLYLSFMLLFNLFIYIATHVSISDFRDYFVTQHLCSTLQMICTTAVHLSWCCLSFYISYSMGDSSGGNKQTKSKPTGCCSNKR